ncbi:hypothetical protein ANCDUO_27202 [Ancylostoma duodenale]|uniref:GOLD domain-containing protein n=1 Tax=Ancylostoma duodenale TaxID=51022 RepID=A0A0C2F791_9BILA|nr:hypothetical protein ANCDUO_27202 [Ancylostoma duodenale]
MDFTVEIPPGKFQCFFQPVDVTKHKTMEVDYQAVDGGDLNINFMIVQENMKTDGSHRLDLIYLEIINYQSQKVVFFGIFLTNEKGEVDDTDLSGMAQKDAGLEKRMEEFGVTVAGFHSSAKSIKSQLNKIEYHQALLRVHEARDRAVMVANLDRLTFWSCTHTLVLIGVEALQVFMIRSLFEDSSKLGQLLRKGKAAC